MLPADERQLLRARRAVPPRLLADRLRPTVLARDELLPVTPAFTELLGTPGLRRGSTVAISTTGGPGATALACSLLAAASTEGAWCAAVEMVDLGVVAVAEFGVALDRLALVPRAGRKLAPVIAALWTAATSFSPRPASRHPSSVVLRRGARTPLRPRRALRFACRRTFSSAGARRGRCAHRGRRERLRWARLRDGATGVPPHRRRRDPSLRHAAHRCTRRLGSRLMAPRCSKRSPSRFCHRWDKKRLSCGEREACSVARADARRRARTGRSPRRVSVPRISWPSSRTARSSRRHKRHAHTACARLSVSAKRCRAARISSYAARTPSPSCAAFEIVVAQLAGFGAPVVVERPGWAGFAVRGPARYFGGEESLAASVAAALDALGGRVGTQMERTPAAPLTGSWWRIGVADGRFAATIAAHVGEIVEANKATAFLSSFSVGCLDRPELADLLARLGVTTLGAVAALDENDVLAGASVTTGRAPSGSLAQQTAHRAGCVRGRSRGRSKPCSTSPRPLSTPPPSACESSPNDSPPTSAKPGSPAPSSRSKSNFPEASGSFVAG